MQPTCTIRKPCTSDQSRYFPLESFTLYFTPGRLTREDDAPSSLARATLDSSSPAGTSSSSGSTYRDWHHVPEPFIRGLCAALYEVEPGQYGTIPLVCKDWRQAAAVEDLCLSLSHGDAPKSLSSWLPSHSHSLRTLSLSFADVLLSPSTCRSLVSNLATATQLRSLVVKDVNLFYTPYDLLFNPTTLASLTKLQLLHCNVPLPDLIPLTGLRELSLCVSCTQTNATSPEEILSPRLLTELGNSMRQLTCLKLSGAPVPVQSLAILQSTTFSALQELKLSVAGSEEVLEQLQRKPLLPVKEVYFYGVRDLEPITAWLRVLQESFGEVEGGHQEKQPRCCLESLQIMGPLTNLWNFLGTDATGLLQQLASPGTVQSSPGTATVAPMQPGTPAANPSTLPAIAALPAVGATAAESGGSTRHAGGVALRSLNLCCFRIPGTATVQLSRLTQLTHLSLWDCSFDPWLITSGAVANLTNLCDLQLANAIPHYHDQEGLLGGVRQLANALTGLTNLTLSGDLTGGAYLAELSSLGQLQQLELAGASWGGVRDVQQLSRLTGLQGLQLMFCGIEGQNRREVLSELAAVCRQLPKLQRLTCIVKVRPGGEGV
jgi:hypothetical protein